MVLIRKHTLSRTIVFAIAGLCLSLAHAADMGGPAQANPLLSPGEAENGPMEAASCWKPSPICVACFTGNRAKFISLLEAGAPLDKDDRPIVAVAALSGRLEMIKILVQRGLVTDSEKNYALIAAIGGSQARCFELLLMAGANPNHIDKGLSVLEFALSTGKWEIVDVLRKVGKTGLTAKELTFASMHPDSLAYVLGEIPEFANQGFELPTDPAAGLVYPLYRAALKTIPIESLRLLIRAGAKLDTITHGKTALLKAAEENSIEKVRALIKAGARVPRKDELLLRFGQNKDIAKVVFGLMTSEEKSTLGRVVAANLDSLMRAAQGKNYQVVELAFKYGTPVIEAKDFIDRFPDDAVLKETIVGQMDKKELACYLGFDEEPAKAAGVKTSAKAAKPKAKLSPKSKKAGGGAASSRSVEEELELPDSALDWDTQIDLGDPASWTAVNAKLKSENLILGYGPQQWASAKDALEPLHWSFISDAYRALKGDRTALNFEFEKHRVPLAVLHLAKSQGLKLSGEIKRFFLPVLFTPFGGGAEERSVVEIFVHKDTNYVFHFYRNLGASRLYDGVSFDTRRCHADRQVPAAGEPLLSSTEFGDDSQLEEFTTHYRGIAANGTYLVPKKIESAT